MTDVIAKYVPNPAVADLLTWTDPKKSGGVFAAVTAAYYMLEKSGYTVLALTANTLGVMVFITCLWSNVSTIVGRGQPPIPKIELTDDIARAIAEKSVAVLNKLFAFLYAVLIGSDLKLSCKCALALYIIGKVGNWLNFLTLAYMGVFVAFVFPKVYILKQKEIDELAATAMVHIKTYYATIETAILSKLPKSKDA